MMLPGRHPHQPFSGLRAPGRAGAMKNTLLLFIAFFISSPLHAAIAIDPEIQKIEARQGQKIKGFITVTNESEFPIRIDVQPEDWSERTKKKEVTWLTLRPRGFSLKPGRSRNVKFVARVPRERDKACISQVFFAYSSQTQNNLNVGMRIGSLIFIKVLGADDIAQ